MAGCAGVSGAAITMPLLSAEDLLADPAWPRLKESLIERTGLAYYTDKDADLAARIHRRLSWPGERRGNLGCEACLRFLRQDPRGETEMDALVTGIAIGETYFFRHREHFDALRDIVLPDLDSRIAGTRGPRIWCAGCADGAEPYSLAILLRHELAGRMAEATILATDISRQYLATAREASFEAWALRATPECIRQACFERRGGRWHLRPRFREGISFERHNLAGDRFPPGAHPAAFDLIVCRNVMIYFAPELMGGVISAFADCLAPGGWLLVGPSEPNMTHFTAFRAVNAPGVTLYQKPMAPAANLLTPMSVPLPEVAAVDSPVNLNPTLDELRALANKGNWESALRCGQRLAEADKLNPLVHFHYGLALEAAGHSAEAERCLRRAIYLDRAWAPAHFHLGVLLRARGDRRRAERSFSNALATLTSALPDSVITGADGVTAAELIILAQNEIRGLGSRP